MSVRSLLVCLAVASVPAQGLARKAAGPAPGSFDRAALIGRADRALSRSGLVRDQLSRIEVSGVPAAVVYRWASCDGILAVAPLPPTAQSFDHVAPVAPAPVAAAGFVFQGQQSDRYPLFRRLAAELAGATGISDPDTPVFAFKEWGECRLAQAVDWTLLASIEG